MEFSSKQRANLRSMANRLEVIAQVGKDGISESSIQNISNYLEAHELCKVKVLKNAETKACDIANILKDKLNCEIVQILGFNITLYRRSSRKDFNHIQF